MSDKKNNNIGKDFERAWSEGIANNDWSLLNDVIVRSVDNFLDNVGDKMNDAMGGTAGAVPLSKRQEDFSGRTRTASMQRKLHEERQKERERRAMESRQRQKAREARQIARRNTAVPAVSFPYKNVAGTLSTVNVIVGGIGMGVTGVSLLLSAFSGLVTGTLSGGAMSVAIFGFFTFLLGKGLKQDRMSRTAARYVRLIGNRQYIDIKTLALASNKSEKKVIRELGKLLDAGYFPEGHFDRERKTFILTDEVFNHYLELEIKGDHNIIDTTARSDDDQEFPTLSPEESAELSRMIREGNDYISRIHSLNNDIPGIEISAKLDRLEGLLKEIFVRVREHPDQMSRIHELMDYYLPTAVKLVDAYKDYDKVSEPGKEILEAKQDIEKTMDTINSALGKLLNKLFRDSVLDVTTDAQVLKTVLIQKGLTSDMEDVKGDNQ